MKKIFLVVFLLLVACGNEVVELENGTMYEIEKISIKEVTEMIKEEYTCKSNGIVEKCSNIFYDIETGILYYAEPTEDWHRTIDEAKEIMEDFLKEDF